jgi:hypothetical protein
MLHNFITDCENCHLSKNTNLGEETEGIVRSYAHAFLTVDKQLLL